MSNVILNRWVLERGGIVAGEPDRQLGGCLRLYSSNAFCLSFQAAGPEEGAA